MKNSINIVTIFTLIAFLLSWDNKKPIPELIPPTFNEIVVEPIIYSSVQVKWGIITQGSIEAKEVGLCWNTTGTPTISDNLIVISDWAEVNHTTISHLESNIPIYLRAFSKTSEDITYSETIEFTLWNGAQGDPITDNDGNTYQKVKYGNMIW